jgi:hypothetical protein
MVEHQKRNATTESDLEDDQEAGTQQERTCIKDLILRLEQGHLEHTWLMEVYLALTA